MNNFCKILVSYHKPLTLVKDEVFVPIHTGRAEFLDDYKQGKISQADYDWMMKNTIGDDSGDNLSSEGHKLCEFTTIYWAWKNYEKLGNPEYIGFSHYRRFFLFDEVENFAQHHNHCVVDFDSIDDSLWKAMNYSPQKLEKLLKQNDFVCINAQNLGKNNYNQFITNHKPEEMGFCLELIQREYPQIYPFARQYLASFEGYYFNMFIMKKEIFFAYCAFLFNIAQKLMKHIDYTYYSHIDARTFVLERMTGIYLYFLMQNKDLKYKIFPIAYIKHPELQKEIVPTFKQHNVPIVFAPHKNTIKYMGVAFQSLLEHISSDKNYDIYVLSDDVSGEEKEILLSMKQEHKNVSIQIITNVKAPFYLAIPEFFKNFDKILYLDSETIILDDAAKLFDVDLGQSFIGATFSVKNLRDIYRLSPNSEQRLNFLKNKLQLNDPYCYAQVGVLLYNIKEMRKQNFYKKMADFMKMQSDFSFSDALNAFCRGKIMSFDKAWNVECPDVFRAENLNKILPAHFYDLYIEARKNPKIIRYCGEAKPWKNPKIIWADHFWKYARISPFYEEILYDHCHDINGFYQMQNVDDKPNLSLLMDLFNYKRNQRTYWYYKLMSKLTWGKKKQKYLQKKKMLKNILKQTKDFLKTPWLYER